MSVMLSLSIKNCLYQMVKSKGKSQKGVHSSSGVVHGWRELICRDGAHSGWRPKMLRTNYCDFLLEQLSLVSKAKSLCQNILCCFCRCCRQQIKYKHPLPPHSGQKEKKPCNAHMCVTTIHFPLF